MYNRSLFDKRDSPFTAASRIFCCVTGKLGELGIWFTLAEIERNAKQVRT